MEFILLFRRSLNVVQNIENHTFNKDVTPCNIPFFISKLLTQFSEMSV